MKKRPPQWFRRYTGELPEGYRAPGKRKRVPVRRLTRVRRKNEWIPPGADWCEVNGQKLRQDIYFGEVAGRRYVPSGGDGCGPSLYDFGGGCGGEGDGGGCACSGCAGGGGCTGGGSFGGDGGFGAETGGTFGLAGESGEEGTSAFGAEGGGGGLGFGASTGGAGFGVSDAAAAAAAASFDAAHGLGAFSGDVGAPGGVSAGGGTFGGGGAAAGFGDLGGAPSGDEGGGGRGEGGGRGGGSFAGDIAGGLTGGLAAAEAAAAAAEDAAFGGLGTAGVGYGQAGVGPGGFGTGTFGAAPGGGPFGGFSEDEGGGKGGGKGGPASDDAPDATSGRGEAYAAVGDLAPADPSPGVANPDYAPTSPTSPDPGFEAPTGGRGSVEAGPLGAAPTGFEGLLGTPSYDPSVANATVANAFNDFGAPNAFSTGGFPAGTMGGVFGDPNAALAAANLGLSFDDRGAFADFAPDRGAERGAFADLIASELGARGVDTLTAADRGAAPFGGFVGTVAPGDRGDPNALSFDSRGAFSQNLGPTGAFGDRGAFDVAAPGWASNLGDLMAGVPSGVFAAPSMAPAAPAGNPTAPGMFGYDFMGGGPFAAVAGPDVVGPGGWAAAPGNMTAGVTTGQFGNVADALAAAGISPGGPPGPADSVTSYDDTGVGSPGGPQGLGAPTGPADSVTSFDETGVGAPGGPPGYQGAFTDMVTSYDDTGVGAPGGPPGFAPSVGPSTPGVGRDAAPLGGAQNPNAWDQLSIGPESVDVGREAAPLGAMPNPNVAAPPIGVLDRSPVTDFPFSREAVPDRAPTQITVGGTPTPAVQEAGKAAQANPALAAQVAQAAPAQVAAIANALGVDGNTAAMILLMILQQQQQQQGQEPKPLPPDAAPLSLAGMM